MPQLPTAEAARHLGIARSPLSQGIDQGHVSPTPAKPIDHEELENSVIVY